MKYHYQYVSAKSVRIELIPEDNRESSLLKNLDNSLKDETALVEIFAQPLSTYAPGTAITKINFMDFPKVALVSFENAAIPQQSCA